VKEGGEVARLKDEALLNGLERSRHVAARSPDGRQLEPEVRIGACGLCLLLQQLTRGLKITRGGSAIRLFFSTSNSHAYNHALPPQKIKRMLPDAQKRSGGPFRTRRQLVASADLRNRR